MNKLHFKTNINCSNCVQKITPILDEVEGIQGWSVDTSNAQKILTVETNTVTSDEIITRVYNAGFEIVTL